MELIKNLHLNKMVYWIDLNMFSTNVLILFSFTINVSTSFKNKIVYLKKWWLDRAPSISGHLFMSIGSCSLLI